MSFFSSLLLLYLHLMSIKIIISTELSPSSCLMLLSHLNILYLSDLIAFTLSRTLILDTQMSNIVLRLCDTVYYVSYCMWVACSSSSFFTILLLNLFSMILVYILPLVDDKHIALQLSYLFYSLCYKLAVPSSSFSFLIFFQISMLPYIFEAENIFFYFSNPI